MTRRIRLLTDEELRAGICPECQQQPCICAELKEPGWVDRLEVESMIQEAEDACDDFLRRFATTEVRPKLEHFDHVYKTVLAASELLAMARAEVRNDVKH